MEGSTSGELSSTRRGWIVMENMMTLVERKRKGPVVVVVILQHPQHLPHPSHPDHLPKDLPPLDNYLPPLLDSCLAASQLLRKRRNLGKRKI